MATAGSGVSPGPSPLQGEGCAHPPWPWPHPGSVSGPHAPESAVSGTPGGNGVHRVHLRPVHGPRPTGAAGSVGAVAKLAGSAPVSVPRNATISLISASGSVTPNCTRPITRTAASSVATAPSWKYGGVIATFRRLGTLKTYRSAGSWVPPKRPVSISWLPVAFQYSSTSPNFWNIWPPIPTPLWQATQ